MNISARLLHVACPRVPSNASLDDVSLTVISTFTHAKSRHPLFFSRFGMPQRMGRMNIRCVGCMSAVWIRWNRGWFNVPRTFFRAVSINVTGLKFLAPFTNGLNHLYGTHLCLVFAEIKLRTECRIQLCARYEVNSFEQSISIETIGLWAKKSLDTMLGFPRVDDSIVEFHVAGGLRCCTSFTLEI